MENEWLQVSPWEFRHAIEPLSIVHDCDGWALVQRGPGGRVWQERYSTAAEAADKRGGPRRAG